MNPAALVTVGVAVVLPAFDIVGDLRFCLNRGPTTRMKGLHQSAVRASSSSGSLGELKTEFGFKLGGGDAHSARSMRLADPATLLGGCAALWPYMHRHGCPGDRAKPSIASCRLTWFLGRVRRLRNVCDGKYGVSW